ncbi:MAG: HisA/HisF-related TIM barrel protein [Gemmatimonadales bacterium]
MSWPRILVCLDVAGGRVVKGTRFTDLKDQGDTVALASRYAEQGADELLFLDIEASVPVDGARATRLDWVHRVADELSIPFAVGGGVRSWEDALALLEAGADRVGIGSAATRDVGVLTSIAERAGAQAVILSLDALHIAPAACVATRRGGRDVTGHDALDLARRAVDAGAGEILLNVIDADGTRAGFDVAYTRQVADAVTVPVVASGGAGNPAHFLRVLTEGRANAALGAGLFHDGSHTVCQVKDYLISHGLEVRPC